MDALTRYLALLDQWQGVKNLISRAGQDDPWERHIADSAQLIPLAPKAKRWLDLGSGGGLPAMVIAILLRQESGASVHMVESDSRKVAFLRTAKIETGAPAVVHPGRIESVLSDWTPPIDAISARALASLDVLCGWLQPFVTRGIPAFLHKGADFPREYGEASLRWTLDLVEHQSRIGPGVIVELRSIERRK